MNSLCLRNFDPNSVEIFNNTDIQYYYIEDLEHIAPTLIKAFQKAGYLIYGQAGRRPKNGKWISVCATGIQSPTVFWIKTSDGATLLNYSSFDTQKRGVPEEEMEKIITQVHSFMSREEKWTTSNNLIKYKIGTMLESQCELFDIEEKNYYYLTLAMKGGANHVMKLQRKLPIELHLDYHQIYGYVMANEEFPMGKPEIKQGFHPHPFAIYQFGEGTYARLKKNGFPIIPKSLGEQGMVGADGEWFDAGLEIPFICDVDLNTMTNNYEFANNKVNIVSTMYYPKSFKGSVYFKPIINEIYTKRKQFKGQPEERFFKILNEVLPGHFERRSYHGGFWVKNFQPNSNPRQVARYNPKVGIFITAYARRMLDKLLHMLPHDKVIGYDTDCVFYEGTKNSLPYEVLDMFGPEMGQLHDDGFYVDVFHNASKSYYGFDAITGEPFTKIAGLSKDGKAWSWNKELREFELKEVKGGLQDEER